MNIKTYCYMCFFLYFDLYNGNIFFWNMQNKYEEFIMTIKTMHLIKSISTVRITKTKLKRQFFKIFQLMAFAISHSYQTKFEKKMHSP